jgi:hypothetical protein
MTTLPSFPAALHADGPAQDRADKMGLYGWLIGGWDMDAVRHLDDGTTRKSRGEIHFGWILGGRAIQDVWLVPAAQGELPPLFGTTLRVYDPGIDAWHIIWVDPVGQNHLRQIGRADGNDIVQHGTDAAGIPVRWRFTEITPRSFHWLGERSPDQGATWRLQVEFFAHRRQD